MALTEIGAYTFAHSGVTIVSLPEGITAINNGTFKNCVNLEKVILPSSVLTIGTDAFHSCKSLTSISLPPLLSTLGDNVFEGCASLESFDFPLSVSTIGRKTLYDCESLVTVTCHWLDPIKIKDVTNNKGATLYVPTGTRKTYKKAKGWKKFKDIVEY